LNRLVTGRGFCLKKRGVRLKIINPKLKQGVIVKIFSAARSTGFFTGYGFRQFPCLVASVKNYTAAFVRVFLVMTIKRTLGVGDWFIC
jgi:hypothetical protein